MDEIVLIITYFGFLLGIGVIIANALKKARIPDSFFLLVLGMLLGPTIYANPAITQHISMRLVDVSVMGSVPDFLRLLALIMIVFTGTFHMGLRSFRRFSSLSIRMALAGTLGTTVIFGAAAHLILGIGWVYGLIIGAILSGTGSSVVFAFRDSLKNSEALEVLKIESVINSPFSVLLPIMLLGFVAFSPGDVLEPVKYLSQFWNLIVVGVGTGILVGFGVARLIKGMLTEYTVLLLFSIALIAYSLSELFGGSGMLAVAVAGLIVGDMVFPEKKDVERFDDHFSEMLRISVFTLLGAQVALALGVWDVIAALLLFAVLVLSRPLLMMPVLRRSGTAYSRRDALLLYLIAPRGISAAAMAPIAGTLIAQTLGGSAEAASVSGTINNIVFLMILFSVLLSTVVAKAISSREQKSPKELEKWIDRNIEKARSPKAESNSRNETNKTGSNNKEEAQE